MAAVLVGLRADVGDLDRRHRSRSRVPVAASNPPSVNCLGVEPRGTHLVFLVERSTAGRILVAWRARGRPVKPGPCVSTASPCSVRVALRTTTLSPVLATATMVAAWRASAVCPHRRRDYQRLRRPARRIRVQSRPPSRRQRQCTRRRRGHRGRVSVGSLHDERSIGRTSPVRTENAFVVFAWRPQGCAVRSRGTRRRSTDTVRPDRRLLGGSVEINSHRGEWACWELNPGPSGGPDGDAFRQRIPGDPATVTDEPTQPFFRTELQAPCVGFRARGQRLPRTIPSHYRCRGEAGRLGYVVVIWVCTQW